MRRPGAVDNFISITVLSAGFGRGINPGKVLMTLTLDPGVVRRRRSAAASAADT